MTTRDLILLIRSRNLTVDSIQAAIFYDEILAEMKDSDKENITAHYKLVLCKKELECEKEKLNEYKDIKEKEIETLLATEQNLKLKLNKEIEKVGILTETLNMRNKN